MIDEREYFKQLEPFHSWQELEDKASARLEGLLVKMDEVERLVQYQQRWWRRLFRWCSGLPLPKSPLETVREEIEILKILVRQCAKIADSSCKLHVKGEDSYKSPGMFRWLEGLGLLEFEGVMGGIGIEGSYIYEVREGLCDGSVCMRKKFGARAGEGTDAQ